ncbi:MAG: glycoside hydrolase family 57 protein [Gammaproteobacteria bacterium]|nr:glycoside hydrolase family 57 protein [Gammaproteobacteria bacterium]
MSDKSIRVVLCWHMHQPYYYNGESGNYILPWTYLHATKDYIDMANIIANQPGAKAVINFAPILLEQLDDYTKQINAYVDSGKQINDPLLMQLVANDIPTRSEEQKTLIAACLRANDTHLINRYPVFKGLAEMGRSALKDPKLLPYLQAQFYFDLLTWYHIAWLGETVKRENKVARALIERASQFGVEERHQLLLLIRDIINSIIPKYRALAAQGQVELAFSPYAHPIIPLMLDFGSARDAMPNVKLPKHDCYPGGEERCAWHFKQGLKSFEQHFNHRPRGCWPSEGSISAETLRLCEKFEIEWVASGESVMRNSIGQSPAIMHLLEGHCLHRQFHLKDNNVSLFFRDDGLSDLIGFTYSSWHANDAVNNLIHHLENIAEACEYDADTIVPIILDGENAWEYYPENGFHFLSALYAKLVQHPRLNLCTFSDCIDAATGRMQLDKIAAGSWVYGTFSTWIGEKDKNNGWDLLVSAKQTFDKVVSNRKLSAEQQEAAEKQLAICEGSDWFWWFGDYNPADSVKSFEQLFRVQLTTLYHLLGEEVPQELNQVISSGSGAPAAGGVMRPGQEGHPH